LIPKQKPTKVVVQKKPVAKMIYNVAPKRLYMVLYVVSDEALKKANPFWKKKDCMGKHLTQIGQKNSNSVQNQVVFHEVLPKETVFHC
jgi:hypothetical protein